MNLTMKMVVVSSSLLLAGTMCMAQAEMGGSSQDHNGSVMGQAAGGRLQGCLSGSADNYTLTDENGAIYHLVGNDMELQKAVGHEVELTGTPESQQAGVVNGGAAGNVNAFHVSRVMVKASQCRKPGTYSPGAGAAGTGTQPMGGNSTTDHQPKGSPGEGAPPEPHRMAQAQQPTTPGSEGPERQNSDSGATTTSPAPSSQSTQSANSAGRPTNSTQQPNQPTSATPAVPPPVTSETPAQPTNPIGSNSDVGAGPAHPATNPASPPATSPAVTPHIDSGSAAANSGSPASGSNTSGSTAATPNPEPNGSSATKTDTNPHD